MLYGCVLVQTFINFPRLTRVFKRSSSSSSSDRKTNRICPRQLPVMTFRRRSLRPTERSVEFRQGSRCHGLALISHPILPRSSKATPRKLTLNSRFSSLLQRRRREAVSSLPSTMSRRPGLRVQWPWALPRPASPAFLGRRFLRSTSVRSRSWERAIHHRP